jgi:hypothetical protein
VYLCILTLRYQKCIRIFFRVYNYGPRRGGGVAHPPILQKLADLNENLQKLSLNVYEHEYARKNVVETKKIRLVGAKRPLP